MKLPHRRQFLHLTAGAATLPFAPHVARAQAYPIQPVKIVVAYPAGGPHDFHARLIGPHLSERFGRPFIVENRAGAGGLVGTEYVVRAQPDGHTLLVLGTANTGSALLAAESIKFNVVRDLAPVAGITTNMFVILVHPSIPVRNIAELIAFAKAKPKRLNMGSAGTGTVQHLGGELLKLMADIDLVHVPYRGEAVALPDLMSGNIQVMLMTVFSSLEHVRSGSLRALAVTGKARSIALPDVPTVAELLPEYEATSFAGFVAPKGTPPTVVAALNKETNLFLQSAEVRKRYSDIGGEVLICTPDEFGQEVARNHDKWAKVIKFAGIKAE